jgi:hypothetical protein
MPIQRRFQQWAGNSSDAFHSFFELHKNGNNKEYGCGKNDAKEQDLSGQRQQATDGNHTIAFVASRLSVATFLRCARDAGCDRASPTRPDHNAPTTHDHADFDAHACYDAGRGHPSDDTSSR